MDPPAPKVYESATQLLAGPSIRQRLPLETLAASPNEVKLHRFPSTVWLLPQPHAWDPAGMEGAGRARNDSFHSPHAHHTPGADRASTG